MTRARRAAPRRHEAIQTELSANESLRLSDVASARYACVYHATTWVRAMNMQCRCMTCASPAQASGSRASELSCTASQLLPPTARCLRHCVGSSSMLSVAARPLCRTTWPVRCASARSQALTALRQVGCPTPGPRRSAGGWATRCSQSCRLTWQACRSRRRRGRGSARWSRLPVLRLSTLCVSTCAARLLHCPLCAAPHLTCHAHAASPGVAVPTLLAAGPGADCADK